MPRESGARERTHTHTEFLRTILTRTHQSPTSRSPAQLQNRSSAERLYTPLPLRHSIQVFQGTTVTIKASPTSRCKALKIITKHQTKNTSDRHVASIQVVSPDEPRQLLQKELRLFRSAEPLLATARNHGLESTSSALSHNKTLWTLSTGK